MMLEFLYTLQYKDRSPDFPFECEALLHAKVFQAADFYDIEELKDLARTKFSDALDSLLNNVSSAPIVAELSEVVQFVYEHLPDTNQPSNSVSFRKILVDISFKFAKSQDESDIRNILAGNGDFAADFAVDCAVATLSKWKGFRKVQCQTCKHIWADQRDVIPDGTTCPGCQEKKFNWDKCVVP
jgi:hypothetical protein